VKIFTFKGQNTQSSAESLAKTITFTGQNIKNHFVKTSSSENKQIKVLAKVLNTT
jgi:hypothetical protein